MPKPEDVVLKAIDKEMDNFIDRVFRLSQERIVDDNKIDTSTLLKTANVNRQFLNKEIVYPALYADNVEFGRMPGEMPPTDALIKWVRRKLGISNPQEAKRTAFAIALAIKKRGIAPFPYLTSSIDKARIEFKL